MPNQIIEPSGFVPPYAVAYADANNNAVVVANGNPLPVAVISGGSTPALADQSVVDSAGVFWLVRDNGSALTYVNWATGTAGTPVGAVSPVASSTVTGLQNTQQVRGTQYNATASATGYAVGDLIENIVVLNITTTPATVVGSAWVNITRGTVLTAAPLSGNLAQIAAAYNANMQVGGTSVGAGNPVPVSGTLAATVADGGSATLGAKADTAYAGSGAASLVALLKGLYNAATAPLPAGTNLVGKFTPTLTASGVTPVTGLVTGPAQSGSFTPLSGRDFNITISPVGAYTNTAQLERQFPGDANWYMVMSNSQRASLPPSFVWNESEAGVIYRVNVLTGAFTVRLSQ